MRVKNSAHPDEKPLIFEGAIFSSLYEGFTDYKILSINIKDKKADVAVQLEYSDADAEKDSPKDPQKIVWTDQIHLINTGNNSWRIDNITFDKKMANSGDLKARMIDFVKGTL